MQIIILQIGTECFGIEINNVKEIGKKTRWIDNNGTHLAKLGKKWDSYDEIIPILDLNKKLRMKPLEDDEKKAFIILVSGTRLMAVPVDKLLGCHNVQDECRMPVPSFMQNLGTRYFEQVVDLNGQLILIFDVGKLFEEIRAVN